MWVGGLVAGFARWPAVFAGSCIDAQKRSSKLSPNFIKSWNPTALQSSLPHHLDDGNSNFSLIFIGSRNPKGLQLPVRHQIDSGNGKAIHDQINPVSLQLRFLGPTLREVKKTKKTQTKIKKLSLHQKNKKHYLLTHPVITFPNYEVHVGFWVGERGGLARWVGGWLGPGGSLDGRLDGRIGWRVCLWDHALVLTCAPRTCHGIL